MYINFTAFFCAPLHLHSVHLQTAPGLHEERLLPLAQETNVDFIWIHGASTVLESTFAYSLNNTGTPVLVVEMGVGMRITRSYGDQLVDGILNLMKKMGIWTGETAMPRKPIISKNPEDVSYLNAKVTAMQFGLPYVVKRKVRPYDTATLNYNWQVWNTEAFSLYTTATEQIDPNGAD